MTKEKHDLIYSLQNFWRKLVKSLRLDQKSMETATGSKVWTGDELTQLFYATCSLGGEEKTQILKQESPIYPTLLVASHFSSLLKREAREPTRGPQVTQKSKFGYPDTPSDLRKGDYVFSITQKCFGKVVDVFSNDSSDLTGYTVEIISHHEDVEAGKFLSSPFQDLILASRS